MHCTQEGVAKGYESYGALDRDSIMIYAATNTTGPSKGDLETVRAMYG